mgnify:CR=1
MKSKFLSYFANIASETAKLSTAKKIQVGCVIVKDNRILSIGYNGMPSGWSNDCEHIIDTGTNIYYETKPEVLHAEANALMKLCKSTDSSQGAVLFVTHYPCIECAKLIYQAGICMVYYINDYTASKGTGKDFLHKAGIDVCQVS